MEQTAALSIFSFKKMKKSNIKWKIKFYLVTVGIPLLFIAVVLFSPSQFEETYLGEFNCKTERLKQTGDGRIILVGGSSTAFGIRSDLIEQEFNRTVVNFGLYAPLGSRIMLETCFDEIREGDIVIFSPEQNLETLSFSFQAKEVWQAIDGHFSMLENFNEDEIKQILGAFPAFAVSKLKYVIYGKPQIAGIYRRDSFNEYGDIEASGRERNIMLEGYDPTVKIDFTEKPSEDFIVYLNSYADRVRKKGAEFYYRFCPMNESAIADEENFEQYIAWLQEKTEFSVLGDPHECVMESDWFYDTNFHLNESGAIVNTYYFVRDLKAELKDSSRTEIVLPNMPDAAVQTTPKDAGNNRDAGKFLYEEKDESLAIVGVTEEGRKMQELFIPQFYNGKKVTEIWKESLSECTHLEKIYISGGMALQDGCFGGCRSLKKIILTGKPSELIAGEDLLAGTDALLYAVDADAYRLDYSWGRYSDKIRALKN